MDLVYSHPIEFIMRKTILDHFFFLLFGLFWTILIHFNQNKSVLVKKKWLLKNYENEYFVFGETIFFIENMFFGQNMVFVEIRFLVKLLF